MTHRKWNVLQLHEFRLHSSFRSSQQDGPWVQTVRKLNHTIVIRVVNPATLQCQSKEIIPKLSHLKPEVEVQVSILCRIICAGEHRTWTSKQMVHVCTDACLHGHYESSQVTDFNKVGQLSTVIVFSPSLCGWFCQDLKRHLLWSVVAFLLAPETMIITLGLSTGDHLPVEGWTMWVVVVVQCWHLFTFTPEMEKRREEKMEKDKLCHCFSPYCFCRINKSNLTSIKLSKTSGNVGMDDFSTSSWLQCRVTHGKRNHLK